MLTFEPLSAENLPDAVRVVRLIFPDDISSKYPPEQAYAASLDPVGHRAFYQRTAYTVEFFTYYAARDEEGRIVGVTGLYRRSDDPPGRVWLGWYGVAPDSRGNGYGREILEWSIAKARHEGYRFLRLWTTDHPDEATAQILYEKLGLHIVGRATEDSYKKIYRELELS